MTWHAGHHLDLPAWSSASHRRTYPWGETILDYYAQIYDQVYFAHHLPYKINGQKPQGEYWIWKTVGNLPPENTFPEGITTDSLRRPREEGLPCDLLDLNAKFNSTVMPLAELRTASSSITDKQALRALTDYKEEFPVTDEDISRHQKLEKYCRANDFFLPTCCKIPTIMQKGISTIFKACGVERIFVQKFLTTIDFPIDSIVDKLPWEIHLGTDGIEYIYDEAGTVLVCHQSHSFSTLICGRGTVLENVDLPLMFPGFWCDEKTTTNWCWETE